MNDNLYDAGKMMLLSDSTKQAERDRMAWEAFLAIRNNPDFCGYYADGIAKIAYQDVDAFLAERDKQRGGK